MNLASDSERSSDSQWCDAFIINRLDIGTGFEEIFDDIFVPGADYT